MNLCRSQRWAAVLLMLVAGGLIWGCSGRKQVPFGLKDAGRDSSEPATGVEDESARAARWGELRTRPGGGSRRRVDLGSQSGLCPGRAATESRRKRAGGCPRRVGGPTGGSSPGRLPSRPRRLLTGHRFLPRACSLRRTDREYPSAFELLGCSSRRAPLRDGKTNQLVARHDRSPAARARTDHRPAAE